MKLNKTIQNFFPIKKIKLKKDICQLIRYFAYKVVRQQFHVINTIYCTLA